MTDNQMMISLIEEIENQFTLFGISNAEVSRGYQPTNQFTGADKDDPIKTRVFLYAITNPNHGRSRRYSGGNLDPKRSDYQHKAKAIQVSVLHYFDPGDVNARTPEDMSNLVRDLIDSPDAIKNLRDKKVFLQECGDVRPIFTINDKDRNESTPNFDLTVNYTSSIEKASSTVTDVESVVQGV